MGRVCKLHKSVASRLIVVLDAHASRHNLAEAREVVKKVFVSPAVAESFHKQVALGRTIAQKLLVIRQRSTNFAMHLGELDLVEQLASLDNVREATEGVVKVLEGRSLHDHFAVADLLLEEAVELDK